MEFNYTILLRNGKAIKFHGEVDTITCFGYVRFLQNGAEVMMFRSSEINQFRKVA